MATPALDRCATIAILSPNGGVGKTTVSILLGELMTALRPDEGLALDADSDYGSLGRVAPRPAWRRRPGGSRQQDLPRARRGWEWLWDHRAEIGHALKTTGTATVHELEVAGTATLHGLETAGTATVHGLETAGTATVHGLRTADSATVHGLESAGSTIARTTSHVVHDLEPWNW